MDLHLERRSSLTFISFSASNPAGYGRVIRSDGKIRIVEERDASTEELSVREVNSGIYAFSTSALIRYIDELSCEIPRESIT